MSDCPQGLAVMTSHGGGIGRCCRISGIETNIEKGQKDTKTQDGRSAVKCCLLYMS